ncbi:sulfatase-like hydrolase/transferase [Massilia sp. X63]|uniref:sulfatase-like hydrolase/transferase n=1 Tax=Massilia sp. X63 TaxID=3237285 RepID=UPI0034DD3DF7
MSRLSRRTLLKGLAPVLAGSVLPARGEQQAARPPNIVWLVSEDNCPMIGAYGDRLARTPVIDALATQGILYRNVYATSPVCAPSRFGIITGVRAESAAPANHMRAVAQLPATLRAFTEYLRKRGYYCSNNNKTDYNCDIALADAWDDSSKSAHWRNREPGQPFFAVFNDETTHESGLFRPDLMKQPAPTGAVTPEQVRVPGYLPDTPLVRRDIALYYNLMEKMDAQLGARLAELEADGLAQDTIVFYYSDNGGALPRSKRYCYDEGLRCALVVRVPERFKAMAPAAPGSTVDAPVTFIDLAPTVLSLAGVERPAYMQGAPFLGPATGAPHRLAFGGRDRMDERYDMIRTVSDGRWRYIRNYMPHRPWGQHVGFAWLAKGYQDWEREFRAGRLNADQARFFGRKPHEELYDLQADPDQLRNLAGRPASRERLRKLRAALDEHMLAINDNGFIPEGSPLEGYVASRAPGAYPLREAMALAARAARGRPSDLATFRAALDERNEVLRFWGAQGLLVLGRDARAALPSLVKAMERDPSPQVRVAAAEAVAMLSDPGRALAVLSGLLDADNPPPVRLQAINALTFLGAKARPVLPLVTAATQDSDKYVNNAARYLALVLERSYEPGKVTIDLAAMARGYQ